MHALLTTKHRALRRATLPLAVVLLAAAAGCRGPSSSGADRTGQSGAVKVDLARIFPAGSGRDLVLENCQNCHTFVPIVVLQMDKDAWHRNSLDHRERVTTLSDEQFRTLYSYLETHFGPDHPVPVLPRELLNTWTGY
jgi:mono/diheme cytochrome c family protein